MIFCRDDEKSAAPRVGCGCRSCYQSREAALDPQMLELANESPRAFVIQPSHEVLRRHLIHYCAGRMDYELLHVSIIKALMELADRQFERALDVVSLQPRVMILQDKKLTAASRDAARKNKP